MVNARRVHTTIAIACSMLACIVLAACAARSSKATAPVMQEAGAPREAAVMPDDPKTSIEKLEAEIETARGQLALAEPTQDDVRTAPSEPMSAAPATTNPSCKPAQNDTCKTSCGLSDSICTNANKICTIAKDLGDGWAQGKCAKANKTCESSRTKCCGCT